jgi:hypothetical protein
MAICPKCQSESSSTLPGQLCERCRAEVLASDVYTPGDLRFVGVLCGVLTAALASMPGAFIGYVIGMAFDNATRGCTIGVVVFALLGLVAGFRIGPAIVLRMERTKRARTH